MPKELEQVKEIIELRKRMDKQQKPIVKKLGDEIGYGRLMQLTEEMWREKAEFKGSELAVGACVSFMVICDHSIKDDNGHCKLCCGAGRVTKGVKDLADELRASNETINRQHEMAQKQEKTIKTLSNELRQLESEYDALLNKLGDKCCACSVDKITDICMSHQPRVSELEAVVKEACDYLDTNELTTIGSTSILHQKLENAIKPPKEQNND